MSVLRCPTCGESLTEITIDDVEADASYVFSEERGKYILYTSVLDYLGFNCPKCNSEISIESLKDHIDKSLVIFRPSGIHKPVQIDLQELPFDTKSIEYQETLYETISTENDEKDSSKKEKKK
jgi:hypothetical protein